MGKRVLHPKEFSVRGHYSPGWEVSNGKIIFVAGQIPWDENGKSVCIGDIEGQTRQVFKNIGAILKEANAGFEDIVKLNIYLTDIRYRDTVNKIRGEVFKDPFPASTQIGIATLVNPEWLLEIEAIAFVPNE